MAFCTVCNPRCTLRELPVAVNHVCLWESACGSCGRTMLARAVNAIAPLMRYGRMTDTLTRFRSFEAKYKIKQLDLAMP